MSTASSDVASARQLHFVLSGVVSSIISIVGVAGNSLNIPVLLSIMKRSASPTFTILLALTVSDLCVMTIYAVAAFTLFARRPPIIHPSDMPQDASNFHVFIYYTWSIAANTAACASNWLVSILTLYRFLAIRFPTKLRSWGSAGSVRFAIAAVCVLSSAVVLPDSMTVGFTLRNGTLIGHETSFYSDDRYNAVYYTVQTCFIHLLPFGWSSVLTVLLIRALHRARRAVAASASLDCQASERDQRRVSVMLAVRVASSLVLTLPSCSYRVARDFFGASGRSAELAPGFVVFRAACDVLELSSYALNFYLFCICNPTYRNEFAAIVTCRRERRPSLRRTDRSSSVEEHSTLSMNMESAEGANSNHERARK